MQEVRIDQEECIGCETCVELCPDIFTFDSNQNKAFVSTPKGGNQECIEEAIASCPVNCISTEEV
jgi:ferredoxin